MQLKVAGIVLFRPLFDIQLPGYTNARSSFPLHSGKCRHGIKWHMPLAVCYPEWHDFPVHSTYVIQVVNKTFCANLTV